MTTTQRHILTLVTTGVIALGACASLTRQSETLILFPHDGAPEGWHTQHWADVSNPAPPGAAWTIEKGILNGSTPRGTWLLSALQYSDFRISFEWKLPERGNSGLAIRAPLYGDPAYDGIELQMVDPRYYPPEEHATAEQLTGALYDALAPTQQVYKPDAWNKYEVTVRGSHIKVVLNGVVVQNVDLDKQNTLHPKRHDGTEASTLKDRPRVGHVGFQELSRGGGHVQIRNVEFIDDAPGGR